MKHNADGDCRVERHLLGVIVVYLGRLATYGQDRSCCGLTAFKPEVECAPAQPVLVGARRYHAVEASPP